MNPTGRFEWIPQLEGLFRRYKLRCEGRLVCCLNPAAPEKDYWLRQRRPSLHPLVTPAGVQVTEQGGHTMPHHKAVWIAHMNVNGVNFYVDEPDTGLIRTVEVAFRASAYIAAIDTRVEWVAPDGTVTLEERRRYRVRAGQQANRVDIETTVSSPGGDVELARDKHAYFHVRPLDVLSEDHGGVVTASNGKRGTSSIYGSTGVWLDLRGRSGPAAAGIMIMGHRADGEQPLFCRDYGTMALNPFLHEGIRMKRNETFRRVYGVIAYDDPETFDREEAYEAFCATTSFDAGRKAGGG